MDLKGNALRRFSLVSVMMKLSTLPGLRFLDNWITEFRGVRTSIDQRVGDLAGYYKSAGDAVGEVQGGAASLDPDIDESGNSVHAGDDEDSGSSFAMNDRHDSSRPHQGTTEIDGLSQNYEDVFYDDGES